MGSFCSLLALVASSGEERPLLSTSCGFLEGLPLLGGGCFVSVPRFTSGDGGIGAMI
jgi:hypothetical protein